LPLCFEQVEIEQVAKLVQSRQVARATECCFKVICHHRLAPMSLAIREAEIRRIVFQSQPWQIVRETLSQNNPVTKKSWWSGSRCRP
jgi:hypothetical protein